MPSETEGGNAAPASDEITYASEEEREAALAEALRYFGGAETETGYAGGAETAEELAPAEASPVQGEVPPQAAEGLLTSDKPQPAEEAESADTGVPQGEGSPADTGASKPEAKPAANTQLTFDTEEDGLEPPSFMAEPVTRPRDKKEGR